MSRTTETHAEARTGEGVWELAGRGSHLSPQALGCCVGCLCPIPVTLASQANKHVSPLASQASWPGRLQGHWFYEVSAGSLDTLPSPRAEAAGFLWGVSRHCLSPGGRSVGGGGVRPQSKVWGAWPPESLSGWHPPQPDKTQWPPQAPAGPCVLGALASAAASAAC